MGFNWWEALGAGAGIVGGGLLGSLVGNPVAGAALGYNVGTGISPGGWQTEDKPDIPTRNAIGLGGDAALASTANVFRQQLTQQQNANVAQINREYGGAGRYTSGQRLGAITKEQDRARGAFTQFLGGTALERYLQEQRLQAQADMTQAQIEAQQGSNRTQLVGTGVSALASIFASNPEYFINLFKGGDSGGGGSAGLTKAYSESKG